MANITSLSANKTLDSRGDETIEVIIELDDGTGASASVPQGKSKSKSEASYVSPDKAIENIKNIVEPALRGLNPKNQKSIDMALIEIDGTKTKRNIGANTILATSLVCARVSAFSENIPLWQYLRILYELHGKPTKKPRLFMNVINGGLHAKNNLDFQEYLIIPKTDSFKEASFTGENVYKKLENILINIFQEENLKIGDEGGFAVNFQDNLEPFKIINNALLELGIQDKVDIGIDVAASNIDKSADELLSIYSAIKKNYNPVYIEDPFKEGDYKYFRELTKELGQNTIISGDDLTSTNLALMEKAHKEQAINGVIIKPNQIGTLTETFDAIKQAKEWGWHTVVSHRSSETRDDFIADLAYATETDGIKLGVPTQEERLTKHNRLIEIEDNI